MLCLLPPRPAPPPACARVCVQNFRNLYVCRLFKTVAEGGTWLLYTASGAWSAREGTAGGCPSERNTR
jgi:hypothetical protein